jgi:hypothetical protein
VRTFLFKLYAARPPEVRTASSEFVNSCYGLLASIRKNGIATLHDQVTTISHDSTFCSITYEVNAMKTIAWLLVAVLTLTGTRSASQTSALPTASETQAVATKQATTAKAEVYRRGVGEKSRVRVRLTDGTEVKGYISKVDTDSFEVTDRKSGKITSIAYADASEVHRQGMSKTTKILIAVGSVAAFIGIATALACSSEGGAHC